MPTSRQQVRSTEPALKSKDQKIEPTAHLRCEDLELVLRLHGDGTTEPFGYPLILSLSTKEHNRFCFVSWAPHATVRAPRADQRCCSDPLSSERNSTAQGIVDDMNRSTGGILHKMCNIEFAAPRTLVSPISISDRDICSGSPPESLEPCDSTMTAAPFFST